MTDAGMDNDSADRQMEVARAGFDEAFQRMWAAETAVQLHVELSNMLHHFYRVLNLAGKRRHVKLQDLPWSTNTREARAAWWVRTFDTHDLVRVSSLGGRYSDFYTNMYGVLEWIEPPIVGDALKRDDDYRAVLLEHVVLDTMRAAFDTAVGFVPT